MTYLLVLSMLLRWCAAHRNRHPHVFQLQTVSACNRLRLISKTRLVQCAEEPLSTAITGEHAPGSVRTVCAGGETDDEDACERITES